ncbi:MAG: AraC family transcriptional regulator [Acidobacteria bacterium]|nr:AraC family transcriptional regulator [Acidobacteriota bacterium]
MNEDHDRASAPVAVASGVDVLSDVIASVRLTGSMLFLVDATPPWMTWAPPAEAFRPAVLPSAQQLVSYHVVTRGSCWAGLRGRPPERFGTGDVLVVPHGDAYFLAEPADAPDSYGHEQAIEFFRRMAAGEVPTAVNAGGGGAPQTQFICGFLGCRARPFNPVLAALPSMIHLRAATPASARMQHLIDFALAELRDDARGTRGVLLRLAELMFVEVVRRQLEAVAVTQSGWLAGLHDPIVARALAALHAEPARHWTLDALAARACTSRSVLAERFTHFVGQPPMQYLTQWRMQMAAHELAQPGSKLVAVAQAVGYESEAAFSRAFKRAVGLTPAAWREQQVAPLMSPPIQPARLADTPART